MYLQYLKVSFSCTIELDVIFLKQYLERKGHKFILTNLGRKKQLGSLKNLKFRFFGCVIVM